MPQLTLGKRHVCWIGIQDNVNRQVSSEVSGEMLPQLLCDKIVKKAVYA